jgi:hypothetical protein
LVVVAVVVLMDQSARVQMVDQVLSSSKYLAPTPQPSPVA